MCLFDAMLLSYMKLSSVCKHYKYGVAAIQHRWNIKIYINEIDLNIVLGVVFSFLFSMNEKPWGSLDVFVRVLRVYLQVHRDPFVLPIR